jgi:hypothetical protein
MHKRYWVCVDDNRNMLEVDCDSDWCKPFIAPILNWVRFWTFKKDAKKYAKKA